MSLAHDKVVSHSFGGNYKSLVEFSNRTKKNGDVETRNDVMPVECHEFLKIRKETGEI